MKLTPPEGLTHAAFYALVQSSFRICVKPETFVEVKLAEITPVQHFKVSGPQNLVTESFTLIFTGSNAQLVPQGIFTFESDALGRFDLFIVPIGRDQQSAQYQATFNRLVKPA